jgi:hypothetical protein
MEKKRGHRKNVNDEKKGRGSEAEIEKQQESKRWRLKY